jgi:hypothetical protein
MYHILYRKFIKVKTYFEQTLFYLVISSEVFLKLSADFHKKFTREYALLFDYSTCMHSFLNFGSIISQLQYITHSYYEHHKSTQFKMPEKATTQ